MQNATCLWPRRPIARWAVSLSMACAAWAVFGVGTTAFGQREPVHYFQSAESPPGTVGAGQLLRGGPLPGYFQPVEIKVPPGASVSVAANGVYQPPQQGSLLVGMLIGPVYALQVIGIPDREGLEVFPTVEIINRLYPPPGLANRFPVPIQLTTDELQLALSGKYVTRVIYLEDPNMAPGVPDSTEFQRYFDVRSDEDPLQVADRLGRPVAILRMGSRTPNGDSPGPMATPPLMLLPRPGPLPSLKSGLEPAPDPPPQGPGQNPPRLPVRVRRTGGAEAAGINGIGP